MRGIQSLSSFNSVNFLTVYRILVNCFTCPFINVICLGPDYHILTDRDTDIDIEKHVDIERNREEQRGVDRN